MQDAEPLRRKSLLESGHQNMAAFALLVLMVFGGAQLWGAWRTPQGLSYPQSWTDFWEGKTTTTLERQLDQHLPLRTQLIAWANGLRFKLTGGAGEQVRVGREGWFFLTEEVQHVADGGQNLIVRADLLQGVQRALHQKGITLLMVLVPDKARVDASRLLGGKYPEFNAPRYSQALSALQSRGVNTVDLLAPFVAARTQNEIYYRTDTHWNQAGAEVAAQSIAKAVQALPLQLPPTRFTTEPTSAAATRMGDLVQLMGLAPLPAFMRPADDVEAPVQTLQASADAGNSLFGDAHVPVVLLGTSYSLRGNFHGYLQQNLNAKVLNMAKDGGGFLQAAGIYFRDEAFRSSPPQLVVWELPERFLYLPLKEEPDWLRGLGWSLQ